MTTPQTHIRRFRTNPVELAIFSVVTLIFVNSLYNLFYDRANFKPTALAPMAANPISESNPRSPASTASVSAQAFLNVDVRCEAPQDQDTNASKVRLTGPLCGAGAVDGKDLLKAQVVNNANKFNATVFTDLNAGKFSTDYIPLNTGKNPIKLEFSYRGGRVVTQELSVVKQ
jgi:hypothetical protein